MAEQDCALKVASMTRVANRPAFFTDEYHGNISKSEARQILSERGKRGCYLIFSTPSNVETGSYTVAIQVGGGIVYPALTYSPKKRQYCVVGMKQEYGHMDLLVEAILKVTPVRIFTCLSAGFP